MVDLARQAFCTNNFDLAAEIYDRTIRENGPSAKLYLGLADSYARATNLQKAFQAYSQAFRLSRRIQPEELNHLVAALVSSMNNRKDFAAQTKGILDIFDCGICKALLCDPVTISCGHSFCRKCLEKDEKENCKKCGLKCTFAKVTGLRTNVLLLRTIEKWFPQELASIKLKDRGNHEFKIHNYKEAITLYSKAFENAPRDHLLLSNRSYAYACLECFQEALSDAELAVKLRPDWPKGYFRKGDALLGLNRHEEAALAFLQCLTLDNTVSSAQTALAKSLHKVLSPIPPENIKQSELTGLLRPSPFVGLLSSTADEGAISNFPAASDNISVDLLTRVKQSLSETLYNSTSEASKCGVTEDSPRTMHSAAIVAGPLEKCASAPGSRPSSPLLSRGCGALGDRSSSESRLAALRLSRKRIRVGSSEACTSPTRTTPPKLSRGAEEQNQGRTVPKPILNREDFECTLCFRLLHQPVTTPCGHVFCRQCLDRCLDHSSSCPLCKSSLVEYLAKRIHAVTEAVDMIVSKFFPTDAADRKIIAEQEIAELTKMGQDAQHEIPVFVCTMAFPSVPCPLHVFEPRYRLMIRQCMESGTRQFGMCASVGEGDEDFADYGAMLEVRDVHFFPDGRSVVDTVGGRRFRVLSRGRRDGYRTAKVEFLADHPVQAAERQEVLQLHATVHGMALQWFEKLPTVPKSRILQHFGAFPNTEQDVLDLPNGPAWHWFQIAVLPLDPRAQMAILAMPSLRERLVAIQRVLTFVRRRPVTQ